MKASQNRLDIYLSLRVGTMFVLSSKITNWYLFSIWFTYWM